MTFAPVIPSGGLTGWSFLTRTLPRQQAAFRQDPAIRREADHFRAEIGKVRTAADLVGNRRLLQVALTAFGLEADLGNRAFLLQIVEGGVLKPESLANKLADKRYADFARAFGFGDLPVPNTVLSDFADRILARSETRRFEAAVGARDGTMRLALNAQRELPDLAARSLSVKGRWLTALGSPPLREVLQTALGLPSGFVRLDLDRQVGVLMERAEAQFGFSDLGALRDPAAVERVIRTFLVRAGTGSGSPNGSAATALALLQAAPRPSGGLSLYA